MDGKGLNQQSKKIMIVIQCKKMNVDSNDILCLCNSLDYKYSCYYYAINHDMDLNDNGELKNKHFHIVLTLSVRVRLITILNYIQKFLKIELDAITIDVCPSVSRAVQYLIHLNDNSKYQYLEENIITNNKIDCHNFISQNNYNDIEYEGDLFELCLYSKNKIDIIRKIGLARYNALYKAIDVIFNERDKYYNE